ncbi:MAG TPA: GNAT family protein, partial [Stellaceae bacterium]|nr:GNAT family protein [Stellaceae bacterium]
MTGPRVNSLAQPIGAALPGWQKRPPPPRTPMEGRFCRVEPLDPERHAAELFAANRLDGEGRNWTYLPTGPFERPEDYRRWLEESNREADRLIHAIVDRATGRAVGVASYLRIDPAAGSIEVGGINYSPLLQRHPGATEAMYLMMR